MRRDSLLVNGEACVSCVHLPQDLRFCSIEVLFSFLLLRISSRHLQLTYCRHRFTKIRYMGATLLEVIHQVQAPQVVKRVNPLFSSLLDVSTKLYSRASNELVSEGHAVTGPIF